MLMRLLTNIRRHSGTTRRGGLLLCSQPEKSFQNDITSPGGSLHKELLDCVEKLDSPNYTKVLETLTAVFVLIENPDTHATKLAYIGKPGNDKDGLPFAETPQDVPTDNVDGMIEDFAVETVDGRAILLTRTGNVYMWPPPQSSTSEPTSPGDPKLICYKNGNPVENAFAVRGQYLGAFIFVQGDDGLGIVQIGETCMGNGAQEYARTVTKERTLGALYDKVAKKTTLNAEDLSKIIVNGSTMYIITRDGRLYTISDTDNNALCLQGIWYWNSEILPSKYPLPFETENGPPLKVIVRGAVLGPVCALLHTVHPAYGSTHYAVGHTRGIPGTSESGGMPDEARRTIATELDPRIQGYNSKGVQFLKEVCYALTKDGRVRRCRCDAPFWQESTTEEVLPTKWRAHALYTAGEAMFAIVDRDEAITKEPASKRKKTE